MYTKSSYKTPQKNIIATKEYYENKIFFVIFVAINQTNKHKAKIYNKCKYTPIIVKKKYFFSSQSIRMSRNSINFDDKKNKKSDFYNKNKQIFNIDDIDVNKIFVSKKERYDKYNSFKYFIGYNNNDVIRPLYLELSQMTGYINEFDEDKNKNKNNSKNKNTITMSLKVKDKSFLKNYNKIWKKN